MFKRPTTFSTLNGRYGTCHLHLMTKIISPFILKLRATSFETLPSQLRNISNKLLASHLYLCQSAFFPPFNDHSNIILLYCIKYHHFLSEGKLSPIAHGAFTSFVVQNLISINGFLFEISQVQSSK